MIDETDRQILNILQENARTSNAEIARQIDMAPSAVLERIRRLEAKGVIQGYEVRINPEALGLGLLAFVFVRSNDMSDETRTAAALAAIPEVQEVHEVAGDDCFYIKVRTQDTDSLGRLLRERLKAVRNVDNTRTTVVLKTFKEGSFVPLVIETEAGDDVKRKVRGR